MATTILRAPALRLSSPPATASVHDTSRGVVPCLSFERRHTRPLKLQFVASPFALRSRLRIFEATNSEAAKTEEIEETVAQEMVQLRGWY